MQKKAAHQGAVENVLGGEEGKWAKSCDLHRTEQIQKSNENQIHPAEEDNYLQLAHLDCVLQNDKAMKN
jgi:hypothetical protein